MGHLRRPHGVRGDLYVQLITDRLERVAPGSRLLANGRWLTVRAARPHQDRWIVSFDEITDREDAKSLTNASLRAEPLPDAEGLWVHELIGSRVVELDGTSRGTCVALVDNPAADLLELDSGALVPVVFVTDVADGVISIDPPEGLFELLEPDDGGSSERADNDPAT